MFFWLVLVLIFPCVVDSLCWVQRDCCGKIVGDMGDI